jgi:site-specific recombinase XerD
MNTKLIQGYSEYLKAAGKRPGTIINHENRVKKLLAWLKSEGLEYGQVRVRHAQEFQGWIIALGKRLPNGYSAGTVRNFVKTAVTFWQYLISRKLCCANPFLEIRKIRNEKRIPRNLLKEKEMNQLLEALSKYWQEGNLRQQRVKYRVHVLCELLYSTAMRIGEAAALERKDIDLERGTIRVRISKSKEDRIVFLNSYACSVLRLYLKLQEDLLYPDSTKLFGACSLALSKHIAEKTKSVCKSLNLHPIQGHTFRHCFGFHFLRAGCGIRYIQELLGHRRLRSTEVYTRVEKEDLRSVLDKHHPRS